MLFNIFNNFFVKRNILSVRHLLLLSINNVCLNSSAVGERRSKRSRHRHRTKRKNCINIVTQIPTFRFSCIKTFNNPTFLNSQKEWNIFNFPASCRFLRTPTPSSPGSQNTFTLHTVVLNLHSSKGLLMSGFG